MDDRQHAGPNWVFLLPSIFAVAGQQDPDTPLGAGDDALRLGWTLPTVVGRKDFSKRRKKSSSSLKTSLSRMTRVYRRKPSLFMRLDMKSPCSVPRARAQNWDTKSLKASASTGIPCPRRETAPSGTCGNTVVRCFGNSGMYGGSTCGTDFMSFKAAILLTTFSWSHCRLSCSA